MIRSPTIPADLTLRPWRLAGRLGLLLVVLGMVPVVLAWVPPRWEVPAWRFRTVAESLPGLALVAIGAGAVLADGHATGRRVVLRLFGGSLVVLALLVVAAFACFALAVPDAVKVTLKQPPLAALGVQRVTLRTTLYALLLAPSLFVAGVGAIRASYARRPTPIV